MTFPTNLTNAVDGSTDVLAEHLNNVEAKIGIDGSAVTTSHSYKLSGVTGTDKAVSKTGEETLTNKTLTTPVISSIYQDAAKTKLMVVPDTASDTLAAIAAEQTFTNKTLTSPKIVTDIRDTNGNEIRKITATASAVNELTEANAATGSSPTTTASGGDDNVGWDIKMKGTGRFRKPTIVGINVVDAATNVSTGDAKAFFRVPAELNGMNLTGVADSVYTAGTTGTMDIQIRNKTDSVDMLSTKLTIDSTETDSSTAATAAVIDTTKDDVATGDILAIDVDAVHTTPAKGLYVELRFELPA